LSPTEAGSFTAIALCYGALGQYDDAVVAVHNSLALQRDQTVATSLLNSLMELIAIEGKIGRHCLKNCIIS